MFNKPNVRSYRFQLRTTPLIILFIVFLNCLSVKPVLSIDVGGTLREDTIWDINNSPYRVKQNVFVDTGVKLTILPGVVVEFDDGLGIDISGELEVFGGDEEKVIFTSSNKTDPQEGSWKGFSFHPSAEAATYDNFQYQDGSIIKNCIIRYAGYSNEGIIVSDQTAPYLENVDIIDSISNNSYMLKFNNHTDIVLRKISVTHDPSIYYENRGGALSIVEVNSVKIDNSTFTNPHNAIFIEMLEKSYTLYIENSRFLNIFSDAVTFAADNVTYQDGVKVNKIYLNNNQFDTFSRVFYLYPVSHDFEIYNSRNEYINFSGPAYWIKKGNASYNILFNIDNSVFDGSTHCGSIDIENKNGGWRYNNTLQMNISNTTFKNNKDGGNHYSCAAIYIKNEFASSWSPRDFGKVEIVQSQFFNNERAAIYVNNNAKNWFEDIPDVEVVNIKNCTFKSNSGNVSDASAVNIFYSTRDDIEIVDPFYVTIDESKFVDNHGCSTLSVKKNKVDLVSAPIVVKNSLFLNNDNNSSLLCINPTEEPLQENLAGKSSIITNNGLLYMYNNLLSGDQVDYKMLNLGLEDVIAQDNFWGRNSEVEILLSNIDYFDDNRLGEILYYPFLIKSPEDINGDFNVDLIDIILGMRILINDRDDSSMPSDLSGDLKFGLEEVLHIIRQVAYP